MRECSTVNIRKHMRLSYYYCMYAHNIAMQVQYPYQHDSEDRGLTNSMGHLIMLLSNC